MFQTLKEDIRTVFDKDPAARSVPEVMLCYPGLRKLENTSGIAIIEDDLEQIKIRVMSNFSDGGGI